MQREYELKEVQGVFNGVLLATIFWTTVSVIILVVR